MRRSLNETGTTLPLSLVPRPPTIHQADECRAPIPFLFGEQIAIGVRSQRDYAKTLPLSRQDLERRSADRPRRAQHRDADAHIIPNMRYNPAAVGITKYSESSRSSTPPWPGMRDEESLRPASRLNSDSAMSPICPTMETARPNSNSCPALKLQPSRFSTNSPSASAVITP